MVNRGTDVNDHIRPDIIGLGGLGIPVRARSPGALALADLRAIRWKICRMVEDPRKGEGPTAVLLRP